MTARFFFTLLFFCGATGLRAENDSLQRILDSKRHDTLKGAACLALAEQLMQQEELVDAERACLYGIRRLEQAGSMKHHAAAFTLLGEIYTRQKNSYEARNSYLHARTYAKEQNDRRAEATVLGAIAESHVEAENEDSAAYYYFEASKIFDELGDHKTAVKQYMRIAAIWARKSPDKTIALLKAEDKAGLEPGAKAELELLYGEAYFSKKQWSAVRAHYKNAWNIAEPLKDADLLLRIASGWQNYYEVNYNEKSYNDWKHVKDSLLRITETFKVDQFAQKEKKEKAEADEMEKTLKEKKQELEHLERERWMYTGLWALGILAVIGFIVYRKNR